MNKQNLFDGIMNALDDKADGLAIMGISCVKELIANEFANAGKREFISGGLPGMETKTPMPSVKIPGSALQGGQSRRDGYIQAAAIGLLAGTSFYAPERAVDLADAVMEMADRG